MERRAFVLTGPASSTGSPITFRMRPRVSAPTGTEIESPVSTTFWPRTRPSVESMAMVRTVFSPRCCATSNTRRLPMLSVSSAFRMVGSAPSSNVTSTTAPMTCVTRPTAPDLAAALLTALAFVAAAAGFLAAAGFFAAAGLVAGVAALAMYLTLFRVP
ncbi:conserved hypothetical protein [Hoeflea sp. EC-HK425]|nr:conserved hypothetical protein [Hoeflea sp. EC-HK425]